MEHMRLKQWGDWRSMGTEATLDEQRERMAVEALELPTVAAGMAVFATASRLAPPPRMVMTSQVVYSAGSNR